MQTVLNIARYEFRLHWRGRSLRVLALTMLVVTLAGVVILQSVPETDLAFLLNAGQEAFTQNLFLTFLTFPALVVLVGFIIPVASSEVIPVDRQLKTIELFGSLPVTQMQYLCGKLLGYWFAGLSALIGVTLINTIGWWLVLGSYDLLNYLELWLVSGIIFIMNAGLAVLIGGTQPNRIRAAALVICILILSTVLFTSQAQQSSIAAMLDLSRANIISYYINHPADSIRLFAAEVASTIVVGLLELVLAFTALWAWRQRRV